MSHTAQTPSRSAFPAVVAILGAFLIFAFFVNRAYKSADQKEVEDAPERPSLAEHEAAATDRLAGYAVLDPAAGKVRLPISRAKELVIAENSK